VYIPSVSVISCTPLVGESDPEGGGGAGVGSFDTFIWAEKRDNKESTNVEKSLAWQGKYNALVSCDVTISSCRPVQ
jgi:hypothetical protein